MYCDVHFLLKNIYKLPCCFSKSIRLYRANALTVSKWLNIMFRVLQYTYIVGSLKNIVWRTPFENERTYNKQNSTQYSYICNLQLWRKSIIEQWGLLYLCSSLKSTSFPKQRLYEIRWLCPFISVLETNPVIKFPRNNTSIMLRVTYLLQGSTHNPQHFSMPVRFFSASRMSTLIWSIPSSMRSNCSEDRQLAVVILASE
jgi:hypothetical protein